MIVLVSSSVYADPSSTNIELYFTGAPEPNSGVSSWPSFNSWCGNTCFPTTTFTAIDPVSKKEAAKVRVWGKDMHVSPDGNTLCFTEFMEYKLSQGTLYTLGRTNGTCGAYMDKALVPPKYNPDAEVVAGGGDGNIVGGTEKYAGAKGAFDDRVFVEFINRSSIVYYNALFFNLMIAP